MPDPTASEYCRFATSRLVEGEYKFREAVALNYEDNIGEVAKVASLVWDAAIDMLSALALSNQVEVTGVSSDMRRYARRDFPEIVSQRWHHLARLHNFQHKPNLPEPQFRLELYYVGNMLELFNRRLPRQLRLPVSSFYWFSTNVPQPDP